MSGTKNREHAVSRRGFLKGAAAVGIAGAAAAGMTSTGAWLAPKAAVADEEETVAYVYHRSHCGCHDSLKCTVRNGRMCLIEPNKSYQDERYGHICSKGIAEIQRVYGAERVQTPVKRVGNRGEAKFESISWDEAYSILKENLEAQWDKYGRESVLVHCASEPRPFYSFLPAILGAATEGATGIDNGLGTCGDMVYGPSKGTTSGAGEYTQVGAGWNRPTNEPRDLVNSKYIIFVGNNVFTSVLTHSYLVMDAIEAGAKTVAVDPHYSILASKCDEFVPVNPGTDAALYLGMAEIILQEKLYDEQFIKARTSFPFLVNKATGKLLTLGEEIPAGKTSAGDYVVWDETTNSQVRQDATSTPALSGEWTIDGQIYCTLFDKYLDHMKQYSADWAAKVTDIPVDKLEDMARNYATSGASAIITGYGGNDKMANADVTGHALVSLVAITGNVGKPGAFAGSFADGFHGYQASLASWKLPEGVKAAKPKVNFMDMPKVESGIHSAIIVGDSPMNRLSNFNKTVAWLESLDFVCAIDMYFTTYTDYADLVLPASTCFENEQPYGPIEAYGGYVLLREKVIDPLFDSKTDFQIQADIAEMLGLRDAMPKTYEELDRYQIDNSTDETISHITFDSLVKNNGVQAQSCQSVIRRAYVDRFGTPSGKMEVYLEKFAPYDQQFATWITPDEISGGKPDLEKKYPLQFGSYKSILRVHNQFWDCLWNNQYEEAHLEMNPIDVDKRGLKSGDNVRVFNDRGEFVTKLIANEAVRPNCVRMLWGAWKKHMVSGCMQNVTNDNIPERGKLGVNGRTIPFNDNLVEVEKA